MQDRVSNTNLLLGTKHILHLKSWIKIVMFCKMMQICFSKNLENFKAKIIPNTKSTKKLLHVHINKYVNLKHDFKLGTHLHKY